MFKDNIVGGSSFGFTLYHKKKTLLISNAKINCVKALWDIALTCCICTVFYKKCQATKCLEHYMHVDNVMLNTHSGGGERRVGPFLVDGFSREKSLICSYLGCLWYRCDCIRNGDKK